jgi:hypothetical protein
MIDLLRKKIEKINLPEELPYDYYWSFVGEELYDLESKNK